MKAAVLAPSASGFTLVELMVIIAVMGIIAAVAIPQVNIWLIRSQIQGASGRLQQDISWAEAYAIRSGYSVQVQVTSGTPTGCSWSITPTASNVSQPVPQMPASSFASQFSNTRCQVLGATTFNLTPTGMVYDSAGTIASSAVVFGSNGANPQEYGYWLMQLSGAGNVRNCATSAPTSSVCNLK